MDLTESVSIDERNVFQHMQDPYCLYFKVRMSVFRLTSWRADFMLEYRAGQEWRTARHVDLILVHPDNDVSFSKTLTGFLEQIPEAIRTHAERYHYLQLSVLRLLRAAPHGLDVANDVPALFWLLAGAAGSPSIPYPRASSLLYGGRKALIRALCGEECVLSVNFFRKLEIDRYDQNHYMFIHDLIQDCAGRRGILQCSTIPVDLVADIRSFDVFETPFFQQAMASKDPAVIHRARSMFEDSRHMAETLDRADLLGRLPRCSSLGQLEALHNTLTRLIMLGRSKELQELKATYGNTFPKHPLAGNHAVQPIRTIDDLYVEGLEMHNCVFSYIKRIFEGQAAIYKVTHPERGTLELDKALNIVQFRLPSNAEPSRESREVVEVWHREAKALKEASDSEMGEEGE